MRDFYADSPDILLCDVIRSCGNNSSALYGFFALNGNGEAQICALFVMMQPSSSATEQSYTVVLKHVCW